MGEGGPVNLIEEMLRQEGEISGKELADLFVHQRGLTPDAALEWLPGCEAFPIVTKASLGLIEWEAGLLFRIKAVRSLPTESWDAALHLSE